MYISSTKREYVGTFHLLNYSYCLGSLTATSQPHAAVLGPFDSAAHSHHLAACVQDSVVSCYALSVEEVVSVGPDRIVVRQSAESR